MEKEINKSTHKEPTLCWTCRRTSYGLCPWFTDFTPVPGWTAEETKIQVTRKTGYCKVIDSYNVQSCPMYEAEAPTGSARCGDGAASEIAEAVVKQAVMDWRRLCAGAPETTERSFEELENFFENECGRYISGELAWRIYELLQAERELESKGA